MIYLNLLLSALLPIAFALGFYFLEKYTKFASFKRLHKQLILGASFGVIAIACTECGYYTQGGLVSISDTAPLLVGFIFGGPAGVIAGVIGCVERLIASLCSGREAVTVWAYSFDMIFAGLYAALLRKYMFENKRPSWGFSIACTIVLEVLCFTLMFLTNISNPTDSMNIIKLAAIPVFLSSLLAVMVPSITIQILTNKTLKNTTKVKEKRRMSTQVQFWLLGSIVVCYLLSSLIIYAVQTNTAFQDANTTFNLTINDVKDDVQDSSNSYLSPILGDVIARYEKDPFVPGVSDVKTYALKLKALMTGENESYKLASVDLISLTTNEGRGDFLCSSDVEWGEKCSYNYDFFMTQFPGQSYDLHSKMYEKEHSKVPYRAFIQDFGQRSDSTRGVYYLKYAAQRIDENMYIAISVDADVFYGFVNEKVADITSYRHVNNTGHIIIMQYDGSVVSNESDPRFAGKELEPEIKSLSNEALQFTRQRGQVYGEDSFYMYCFAETYKIVVVLPYAEVLSARDSSFILNTFMEIIVFAILYALIYFLLKKKVVKKIENINESLGKIIDGDLYVKVEVDSSYEFASLSKDINSTVDKLKDYIDEAAKRIDDELAFAKTIQLNSLPSSSPNFPGKKEFNLYATMNPAKEVGGDFYDYYLTDKHTLAFLVADVSGKGIPAAMMMMEGKATIKNLARNQLSPEIVMDRANESIAQNNKANMFITCWLGLLDLDTGHVKFVNAGHTNPLIYHKDGSWEYYKQKKNMVLAAMEDTKYTLQEFDLKPGDRIYLYTDGVTEATRNDGVLYGEERLINFLNSTYVVSLEDTLLGVKQDIDLFVEGADQFDDITMLCVEYTGPLEDQKNKK